MKTTYAKIATAAAALLMSAVAAIAAPRLERARSSRGIQKT